MVVLQFTIIQQRTGRNSYKLRSSYQHPAPLCPGADARPGYNPVLIEDPAPFTVEISRYRKYGELLRNSVESYLLRDKVVLVMKDTVWVEQAVAMGIGGEFLLCS